MRSNKAIRRHVACPLYHKSRSHSGMLPLQIFGLMNLIIDRLGDSVKPFANGLLGMFPQVWQDAEGQSLLRIQVCGHHLFLLTFVILCSFSFLQKHLMPDISHDKALTKTFFATKCVRRFRCRCCLPSQGLLMHWGWNHQPATAFLYLFSRVALLPTR